MRYLRLGLALCASVISMCALTAGAGASDPSPPVTVAYAMDPADWKFDPATAYNPSMWQVEYATCAKLVDFPDSAGASGLALAPDAAISMPQVSADGLTYTFTIRSGLGFSPPSTEQVTADSFRVAIERAVKLNPTAAGYLSSVQGVSAYAAGTASSISGLTVSGNDLTLTLTQPDGALPAKLAEPFFCAVPTGTPSGHQTTPLPSAGPYYIDPAGATGASFHLLRNPNYGGSRPSVLPEIDVTVGGTAAGAVAGAKTNPATVDYAALVPPSSSDASSYGAGSPAALAGHQQYFESPVLGTASLAMNTTTVTLQNVSVRKAIATVLNRSTLASLSPGFGAPTDQFLPPNMPGYRDEPMYPLGGDVPAAQALMQSAGYGLGNHLHLKLVTGGSPGSALNTELVSELSGIYIDVTVQQVPNFFSFVPSNSSGYDLAVLRWNTDYADAENLLAPFFDGVELAKANNVNWARFDDAGYNEQFRYARSLVGDARATDYGNLDVDIARNAAPMAAFASATRADFFSPRIGCQVDQPVYGFDFTRLCIASTVAPGDTSSTGADATPSAPVQTAVTSPNGGSVSVTSGGGASDTSGYNVLGTSLSIEAPAAQASAPLRIEFEIDSATLAAAGANAATVTVFRNGVPMGDCPGSAIANPDPCVTSRSTDAQGDAHLVVLTSHASTWSFGKADTTAPALRSTALSRNPILAGGTTTLSASADPDAVAAEFFIDHDEGAGNNTPLNGGAGSFTSPAFGSLLTSGVYAVGIRVRDRARNWSPVQYQYLVVSGTQASAGSVSGGGFVVPSASGGDVLPGIDGKSKANLGFLVESALGASTPTGELEFNYNVSKLRFHAASFDWLVDVGSNASFQGRGTLGNSSDTSVFRVYVVDGSPDRFAIQIWAPGVSPDAAAPLYSASGALGGGQIVVK